MKRKIDVVADAHHLVDTGGVHGGKPQWSEIGSAVHRVVLNKGLTLEGNDPVLDLYRHEIEELGLIKVKFLANTDGKRRITATARGRAAHAKAAGWIKRGKFGRGEG